jgi:hypothetical protein
MQAYALAAFAAAHFFSTLPVTKVAAATCAEHAVSVHGEASRFELLAKAKARGNWRAKVRAMPELGAPYANWSKALGSEYSCAQRGSLYVCSATAYPCKD